ncbi:MAG: hypothetical protein WCW52_10070 [Elusimicrobiales bacterium]
MKKVVFILSLFAVPAVCAAGQDGPEIPVPGAPIAAEDLAARFNRADANLGALRNSLTWVSRDLDELDRRANNILQTHTADSFFQSDLDRASRDMSRRVEDLRLLSGEIKNLLDLAQKDPQLNKSAKSMDWSARDILARSWPTMQDSAGRLESTVGFGDPQLLGYNAQWLARDISRNARQFTDLARTAAADTKSLAAKTQP